MLLIASKCCYANSRNMGVGRTRSYDYVVTRIVLTGSMLFGDRWWLRH